MKLCEKNECVGCGACVNICPHQAIEMTCDERGFNYPIINQDICIGCGLCQKGCFVIHGIEKEFRNGQAFACMLKDEEVLKRSSSGGAFFGLAKAILDDGGIVFGASYNENMVVQHCGITQSDDLWKLQGSKYVQSSMGQSYKEVREHLRKNHTVLFSGTGCQIAGLYAYLGKDDDNLITCDVLCKGVPSPRVFADYIDYLKRKYKKNIQSFNFRSKRYEWGLGTEVNFEDGKAKFLTGIDGLIMRTVGKGYVRESCFSCKFTRGERISDITIGDFWHIGEKYPYTKDASKGVSAILCNTSKGEKLLHTSEKYLWIEKREFSEVEYGQGTALTKSLPKPKNYNEFFSVALKEGYYSAATKFLQDHTITGRIKELIPPRIMLWGRKIRKRIR